MAPVSFREARHDTSTPRSGASTPPSEPGAPVSASGYRQAVCTSPAFQAAARKMRKARGPNCRRRSYSSASRDRTGRRRFGYNGESGRLESFGQMTKLASGSVLLPKPSRFAPFVSLDRGIGDDLRSGIGGARGIQTQGTASARPQRRVGLDFRRRRSIAVRVPRPGFEITGRVGLPTPLA